MYLETDVLVIGSGLAGLCAAMRARENGVNVVVAAKGKGATPNINGFRAWEDGTEQGLSILFEQVMEAGGGINDEALVLAALRSSCRVYSDLEKWGVEFLRDDHGKRVPKLNGGFVRGYQTKGELGKQASIKLPRTMMEQGIVCLEHTEILYPVLQGKRLIGAVGERNGETVCIQAKAVIVACGGIGSLFSKSTYPEDVCAGYVPFALLAGAELVDMEFLQYEPAVCCGLPKVGHMPLPTKLWGCGAKLINGEGEHFLPLRYGVTEKDLRKNGPLDKDLMARRIDTEIRSGRATPNGGVWYDARQVEPEEILQFTLKVQRLARENVDLCTTPVEICPGPHSHMGGILIDKTCASSVEGLYAAGESAAGFLGASRMSGFGGASAAILGSMAGCSAALYAKHAETLLPEDMWMREAERAENYAVEMCSTVGEVDVALQTVRRTLDENYGIIKDAVGLQNGVKQVERLTVVKGAKVKQSRLSSAIHAFGAVYAAKAMFSAGLQRQESRGSFFRSDYPEQAAQWRCSIVHRMDKNAVLRSKLCRHQEKV